jgi:hypothetical protein
MPSSDEGSRRTRLGGLALAVAIASLAFAAPAGATTFSVADGDVGGLVAAIVAANDEATFPGQDAIALATDGTYVLTGINNLTDGPNGLPSITSAIVINASGATIRRAPSSGVPDFRIFHVSSAGSLTLNRLELQFGRATFASPGDRGGGVYSQGALTLDQSTVANNTASGSGGGVYSEGSFGITSSTLSENSAGTGGGLSIAAPASGTLLNATVTQNGASTSGGGIAGSSGAATYKNTIVAGNLAPAGPDCSGAAPASGGFNLVGSGTGCPTGGTDLTTANVANELDTTLAENGGPTRTHALIAGSQAIDAGTNSGCPATDQRLENRPVDGDGNVSAICDIGSYELVPPAGVLVSPTSVDVVENGATDTYQLSLQSQPSSDVTISFDTGSQLKPIADLTFTPANWNTPQTVTLEAVDDDVDEPSPHTGTITHMLTSADAHYDALPVSGVTANITDNDTSGVSTTETGGSTDVTEGGATDTYSLVLASEPTSNVTISFDTGSQLEPIADITFTPANWDTPQAVTVQAKDDDNVEGPHTGTIAHTVTSADPGYDGLAVAAVIAHITDDDVPPVTGGGTQGAPPVTEATGGGTQGAPPVTGAIDDRVDLQLDAPARVSLRTFLRGIAVRATCVGEPCVRRLREHVAASARLRAAASFATILTRETLDMTDGARVRLRPCVRGARSAAQTRACRAALARRARRALPFRVKIVAVATDARGNRDYEKRLVTVR